MKKRGYFVLLGMIIPIFILGLMSFPATGAESSKAKPIELRMVVFLPKGNQGVETAPWFVDRVNKEAKGELTVRYVGGPEAIPMFEQPEAVRSGAVDVIFNVTGFYVGLVPEGLSMQLSQLTPMEERKSGYYDLMLDIHKKKLNAYYLGRFTSQRPFFIGTTSRIQKPQDLSKKRISTGRICDPFIKKVGAMAMFLPLTDVYTALERNMLDGLVFSTGSYNSFHWGEVAKYIVNHPLFPANNQVILMNLNKWNQIPQHLQDIIKGVVAQIEAESIDYYLKQTESDLKTAKNGGSELIEFSNADVSWMMKTALDAQWEEVAEKVSPEIYNQLKKTSSR